MAFNISPQPLYIFDTDKKRQLLFDGVIKTEHTLSLKIEDDPSNIKDGSAYVNNAKNDPNEVTIEVMMSNVYTSQNDLAGKTENRTKNAYEVLQELKTSRRKCEVVTSIMTYKNMLLKTVQVLQDENTPFGWSATLTFREAPTNTGAKNKTQSTSCVDDGTTNGRTPSVWVNWVGANRI